MDILQHFIRVRFSSDGFGGSRGEPRTLSRGEGDGRELSFCVAKCRKTTLSILIHDFVSTLFRASKLWEDSLSLPAAPPPMNYTVSQALSLPLVSPLDAPRPQGSPAQPRIREMKRR